MSEKKKPEKTLIAFDLDGTLTESRSALDKEMADLLCDLLSQKQVVVVGGGAYEQFKKQFLEYISCEELFGNLFLLPTSGSSFYVFEDGKWEQVYRNVLSPREREKIKDAFQKVFTDIDYKAPEKTYGQVFDDRGTQITFSALGQEAPLEKKKEWNASQDIRGEIQKALEKYIPEFEIRRGGTTSIDVTKKGVDKGSAISQIMKTLETPKENTIFVGDALYEGGNDFAVIRTGVETVEVSGPEETKHFIRSLLTQT